MEENIKIEYIDACNRGNLQVLESLVETHGILSLEHECSKESLSGFMTIFNKGYIDCIDYLLHSEETKTKLPNILKILRQLKTVNDELIDYLCSDKAKEAFDIYNNTDHFKAMFEIVCAQNKRKKIKNLGLSQKTKDFHTKKLSGIRLLAYKPKSNNKLIKTLLNDIFSSSLTERESYYVNDNLQQLLLSSLNNNNGELTDYLIFDTNIEIEENTREQIKRNYPEIDKLLASKELKDKLDKNLSNEKTNQPQLKI